VKRLAQLALCLGLGMPCVAGEGDKLPPRAPKTPQARAPVFPSGLDMVNLTLSVRDEEDRLVTDLEEPHFVVYEDGRPQRIQLFARAVEPQQQDALALDLGMLFDTSESMLKELRFAQEAASRFLESIPRARNLLTIFFDQDIRVSRYDSERQQGLMSRIFESSAGGHTALRDAITVYVSRASELAGRKVLVLFSDGEDTTSAITLQELLALVRSSNVTIYPVAFTGSFSLGSNRALAARSFLAHLAELSGGTVFFPRASKDLPVIYDKILDELKAQYVVGYVPDNARRDGKYRKVRVEVSVPGLKVRARPGYTAPRD
jgi:Ca-activated chloride channel family protein